MKNTRLLTFCIAVLSCGLFASCLTSEEHPKVTIDGDADEDAVTDAGEDQGDAMTDTADAVDGDNDSSTESPEVNEASESESEVVEKMLCDPYDYDESPLFGWEDYCHPTSSAVIRSARSAPLVMPVYSWTVIGFSYLSEEHLLDIIGLWYNKLPYCACGADCGEMGVAAGKQVVKDFIDEHGIGQGSGLLTIRYDLETGDSYAVARSIGTVTLQNSSSSSGFSGFTLLFPALGESATVGISDGAGYDARGCPIDDEQDTRTIWALSDSPHGRTLNLCGRNDAGEEDCNLPAASSEPVTVVQKTPGAYTCDAQGCVLVEETR